VTLDNLQKKRVPLWFVQTVRSFLTDCTTTLLVDNKETEPYQLQAGVPQGSLLSLILFLFYNALLLKALNQPDLSLSLLGFTNNVNLLMYKETIAENCSNLETAHEQCLDWACTHRMRFATSKYTLTHFTRRRDVDT
jgi:hypothetical protein